VAANLELHADWHESRGEPRPVNPNDPPPNLPDEGAIQEVTHAD
jgi:hypothetical protein